MTLPKNGREHNKTLKMPNDHFGIDGQVFKGHFSLREFIVDFFGSLMPGVLFLCFLILSLGSSILSIIEILKCQEGNCDVIQNTIQETKDFFSQSKAIAIFIISTFFITVGYVIGTLFYRRDPKYPDYKSFLKIASCFTKSSELKNWVVRVKMKNKEYVNKRLKNISLFKRWYHKLFTIRKLKRKLLKPSIQKSKYIDDPKLINALTVDEKEVQYPYNNLRVFLEKRGRNDLAKRVFWLLRPEEDAVNNIPNDEVNQRTKTFINSLKLRLQFRYPEKCGTINKNEAHIRLSSSMWYASNALINISMAGLTLLVIVITLAQLSYENMLAYLYGFAMNVLVIGLSWSAKRSSEKFLHYQRVREIFYVIDTAELAEQIDQAGYSQSYYFKDNVNVVYIQPDE
jgi:hypothetical protein